MGRHWKGNKACIRCKKVLLYFYILSVPFRRLFLGIQSAIDSLE